MRFILGLIVGLLLGLSCTAIASDISAEALLNRVYISLTESLRVEGI